MRVNFGVLFIIVATMPRAKALGKRPAASRQVMPKVVTALTVLTAPEGKPVYTVSGDGFLPPPDDDKPLSREEKIQ